jgi:hypothetical protein
MTNGTVTHDASVQRIDDFKFVFQGDDGSREANFKDSYRFNIAAWKLARMLGIEDMIPPSIERSYEGMPGSFTWWIDDVQMDEGERVKDGVSAPDAERWDQEMQVVHVFDELIYNTDRNLTNLLIDKQWRIWMIDHTRAFRAQHDLRNNKNLVKCDRNLLAKMKALNAASLGKQLSHYVSNEEIRGLLARRDTIVRFVEQEGAAALYDRPPRT